VKSFRLVGLRDMTLLDVPDPQLQQPTDVLIRIGAVGVCGSDIHYFTTGRIGCQVVQYPFTVGHECAGTVIQTGPAVTRVRAGDRVAIEPAVSCGHCDQCRSGRENTCRQLTFLGCPGQAEGSLSQYLVMPERNCFRITEQLSLAEATLSEPLAIGVYAVQQSRIAAGSRIGILGLGPVGRSVLLPALDAGCNGCYGTDLIDARRDAAARAGATWVGDPQRDDVVSAILDQVPFGLDAVFECCGQQAALDQAVELLRPGGTLLVIGIPEVDRISFDPDKFRRKEITLVNVRRQRGCVPRALDLIAAHHEEIAQWITHRFPFSATPAAFDLVADYRDGVLKAMVEITGNDE
jgi:L-iditol 2-dehydrogenase